MSIRIFSLFFLVFLSSVSLCSAQMMSVNGENVNLRSGPGTKYSVKWEYGQGFPLNVLERKSGWAKVSDFEKDTGWIHDSLLSKKEYVIVKVHRGNKKKINIRSGPGTSNDVVGQAFYGVVFERLEKKSGWLKVRHETGLVGWIKQTLLWGSK